MRKKRALPYHTRESSRYRRVSQRRQQRRGILICCEGSMETEYFHSFRTAQVKHINKSTSGLVEQVIEERQRLEGQIGARFDEVWCVFDIDNFTEENTEDAFVLAKKHGIRIAYSKRSFEVWIVLHFTASCGPTHSNKEYTRKLDKIFQEEFGRLYDKASETLYDDLLPRQSVAIENAKRLFVSHSKEDPFHNDPCTTVHLLVATLMKNK